LINSIKKKLISKIKKIGYSIFSLVYGKITDIIDPKNHPSIKIYNKIFDNFYSYKVYEIKNCTIYTDTVTDTAFIAENKIIEGPSFQLRKTKNVDISNNVVFQKGTPKLKKILKGSVLSLLTGGGGNENYWHWLFDVLPRIKILDDFKKIDEINFFLLPDIKKKFQIETLDLLNIPRKKRISSKIFRHVYADAVFSVDHPYVLKNNPSIEIQNIPKWIIEFLRKSFLKKNHTKKYPSKIYIDRRDSISNHSHLRKIINEEEVKDFLIKRGFSIIVLSELSFEEQVHLFKNANKIIGLHGAGFANLTFCDPGANVLELKSKNAGFMYANLAKKLNLNHSEISINPYDYSNNDQQGFIKIPINLLEKKIS